VTQLAGSERESWRRIPDLLQSLIHARRELRPIAPARTSYHSIAPSNSGCAGVALHAVLAMAKTRPRAEIVAAVRSSGARVYREDPDLVLVGNLALWFRGEELVSVDRMFGPQECVISGDT
jgi:hypothetical protein